MKVAIVVSHPNQESLTWSVCEAFQRGVENAAGNVEFDILDLYADKFSPEFQKCDLEFLAMQRELEPQIIEYQQRIDAADALVVVTPIYWWSLPAMLKGFFDRVFTPGWAYDVVDGGTSASLADRPALILALGATDAEAYDRHGYEKSFKTQIEYGIFSYCGIKSAKTEVFFSVIDKEFGGVDPEVHLERAANIGSSFGAELTQHVSAA